MTSARDGNEKSARGIELLWGERGGPRRVRPGLSVDRIVTAAMEIADTSGLDAVSMQRVAAMLDFTTMSLYRYVPGKTQLIELMMDAAAGTPPDLSAATGWRERMELWTTALWERYQRHPWMLQVQVSGPPVGPNQLSWLESSLASLAGLGLGHEEILSISLFLNGAVTGLARLTSDVAHAAAATGVDAAELASDYSRLLERLLDADRFPTLSAVVASGAFGPGKTPAGGAPAGGGREFTFALQRLLDGVESLLEERNRPPR